MTEVNKTQENEELNKSLDLLIDELFVEEASEEVVEKSMIKDEKPQKETADEAMRQVPKSENDENRNAGRPEQISDVPANDEDGKREGQYDSKIAKKNEDGKVKEQDQVQPPADMKKSLSDAEYAEYQALKAKAAKDAQAETLAKAKVEKEDLIKSAVEAVAGRFEEKLSKANAQIEEQAALIKSLASKPKASKAITSVQAVERFAKSENAPSKFSKNDVLDVAEELVKSGKITAEHVIELEQTGFIYETEARGILERELKRRG